VRNEFEGVIVRLNVLQLNNATKVFHDIGCGGFLEFDKQAVAA
jgi:hypothetical protein